MDNNNWNNQQGNQWNGNQQAGQWNGNYQQNNMQGYNQQGYNQQGYNQQGYGAQPPLGQQVDLQAQYQQQQMYGAPVPQKKKGPGKIIAILLVLLAIVGTVFGVSKLTGKDKEDATATIEPTVEVTEDIVVEPETPEGVVEVPEVETTETETEEVQLDEMVEGKIPTPQELGDVLESLEFSQVYARDTSLTTYTLDVDYQIFDNRMSAEIRYESILDTLNDRVNTKHDNTGNHEAYEIVNTTDRDGYQVVQVLVTKHNKDCSLRNFASNPYVVEVYILKGNTILDYEYEMKDDKVQGSTARALEKALEKIEYVTVDKLELNDKVEEPAEEVVEETIVETETTEAEAVETEEVTE